MKEGEETRDELFGTTELSNIKNLEQLEAIEARNLDICKKVLNDSIEVKQEDAEKMSQIIDLFHSMDLHGVILVDFLGNGGMFYFNNGLNIKIRQRHLNWEDGGEEVNFELAALYNFIARLIRRCKTHESRLHIYNMIVHIFNREHEREKENE